MPREVVQAHTPEIAATARRLVPEVERQLADHHAGDPARVGAGPLGGAGDVLNIILMVLNALHAQGIFSPNPTTAAAGQAGPTG